MSTITTTQEELVKANKAVSIKSDIWEQLEFSRYWVIVFVMGGIAIIGAIAAAFAVSASLIQLCLVVFPTMIGLSMILAVSPMRVIMGIAATAILIDLCIIFINVLG
jgi:hypothetical protein